MNDETIPYPPSLEKAIQAAERTMTAAWPSTSTDPTEHVRLLYAGTAITGDDAISYAIDCARGACRHAGAELNDAAEASVGYALVRALLVGYYAGQEANDAS